jgi:hypothetical protein
VAWLEDDTQHGKLHGQEKTVAGLACNMLAYSNGQKASWPCGQREESDRVAGKRPSVECAADKPSSAASPKRGRASLDSAAQAQTHATRMQSPSSAPFQRVNSAPPVPYDYDKILARYVTHDHDAPVVMPHSPEAYQTILAAIEKDVACLRRLRSLKT